MAAAGGQGTRLQALPAARLTEIGARAAAIKTAARRPRTPCGRGMVRWPRPLTRKQWRRQEARGTCPQSQARRPPTRSRRLNSDDRNNSGQAAARH